MTRNRNKRNARRERNHNKADVEKVKAIFGLLAATLNHICYSTASPKPDDKPFNGIRQVSEDHIKTGVIIPADGSAVEMKIPEGFEVFISEDGKPMIHKKVEGNAEPARDETEPASYNAIANNLFNGKRTYFNSRSDIDSYTDKNGQFVFDLDNCVTEAQCKRLLAFNKLQNIAKFLNDGWTPNFFDSSRKYFIWLAGITNKYTVGYNTNFNEGSVYFKSEELANKAINIMGKESLADLFNTEW